jgi:hypothetical protein
MNSSATVKPHALAYSPDLEEVTARLRMLYERRATDRIFAVMNTPSRALAEFAERYVDGPCDYPDPQERLRSWDAHLARKAEVFDDSVPSAYLSECDQGLYGGAVGGEVRYMADGATGWISSMVPPILRDWSGLQGMKVDTQSQAFRRFREELNLFASGSRGRFGISHFILIDSLNFGFELMGATETYTALIEQPETMRRVIDFAFDLNVLIQGTFFNADVLVAGGTCSNMVQWIPGRIVSESIDPFHMTSVGYFEQWGREPVERILNHFDGGVIHIHGNGRHLLEATATVCGLKAIYLGDDRGFPRAFDILPQIRSRVGDMPLVVPCGFGEFVEKLRRHQLTGGVLYQVSEVPDSTAANQVMEQVRAYRLDGDSK